MKVYQHCLSLNGKFILHDYVNCSLIIVKAVKFLFYKPVVVQPVCVKLYHPVSIAIRDRFYLQL